MRVLLQWSAVEVPDCAGLQVAPGRTRPSARQLITPRHPLTRPPELTWLDLWPAILAEAGPRVRRVVANMFELNSELS